MHLSHRRKGRMSWKKDTADVPGKVRTYIVVHYRGRSR